MERVHAHCLSSQRRHLITPFDHRMVVSSLSGLCLLAVAAVAHLLPSVQQPVSLLPPPGALGPSAAAARAARAAQQQQQQLDADQEGEQDPQAAAAAAPPPGRAQSQAVRMAGAVLEEVLTDAWAEEDVISAFERLQPAPVPMYTQVCKQAGPQAPQHQLQAHCTGQQLVQAGEPVSVPQQVDVHAALQQQDFHAFAEYVLDNALLGTLQEGGVAPEAATDVE